MSGSRFVVLLAGLAVVAVAVIALGVPDDAGSPSGGEFADASTAHADDSPIPPPEPDAAVSPLGAAIDEGSTTSADTAAAWSYRRTAVADLDADGVPERLVVASDVFVTDDGEPLWSDLHRWAVYVEEDDGSRTLVYSAFAPPGGVSVAVGAATGAGHRGIVVIEQGARRGRLLLASYDGAGRARLVDTAGAELDSWVETVAEETR